MLEVQSARTAFPNNTLWGVLRGSYSGETWQALAQLDGQDGQWAWFDRMCCGWPSNFMAFFLKTHNYNLIMRNIPDNLETTRQVPLRNVTVVYCRQSLETRHCWEEPREAGSLNVSQKDIRRIWNRKEEVWTSVNNNIQIRCILAHANIFLILGLCHITFVAFLKT